MRLPKVPSKLRNKSCNTPVYDVTRLFANAKVTQRKNHRQCQGKSTSAKGNNISRSVKCCSYSLYFMIMAIKYAHQTNDCNWNLNQFCVKIIIYTVSKRQWNNSSMQHHYSTTCENFRFSSEWDVQMAWTNRFSLLQKSSICEKLPSHFEVMLMKCLRILICHLITSSMIYPVPWKKMFQIQRFTV